MPICDMEVTSVPHKDEILSISMYVRDDTKIGDWETLRENLDEQYPDWKQSKGKGIHRNDIHIEFTAHVKALHMMILDALDCPAY